MVLFSKMNEELALQEAVSTGLKSMEHLTRLVANEPVQVDCREITDFAVSKIKKATSMLNRTGHARFRRGPVQVQAQAQVQVQVHDSLTSLSLCPYDYMEKATVLAPAPLSVVAPAPVQTELTLDFAKPSVNYAAAAGAGDMKWNEVFRKMETSRGSKSSILSSITGEGSVSNGKQVGGGSSSSMLLLPVAQAVSAGKQPVVTGKRCREHEQSAADVSGKSNGSGNGKCNCKKRKVLPRKVIRTPAISSKIADIPTDECSWRKYGQKPIKGSAYPRAYYKCTSVRGCPAKKHVERAMDDPMMLIITYEDEHRHTQVVMQENNSQMVAFGSVEGKKE